MSSQAEQLQQLVGFFKVEAGRAEMRMPERRAKPDHRNKGGLVKTIVKPLKDAVPTPALQVDEGSFQRF
jgi:hypothetical protein